MEPASIPAWNVPTWEGIRGLRHRFYGRRGGQSRGEFATLNYSSRVGDVDEDVEANRRLVISEVSPLFVAVPNQVHGDRVHVIADATENHPGEADAVIATVPGIAPGILTADCVPILIVAPEARIAAAVHAGWKGTALQIARRTVERLVQLGIAAEKLQAALGPSIGRCCFEVGDEVVSELETGGPLPAAAVDRGRGRPRVDLRAVNAAQLAAAGIPRGRIFMVGPCTRCSPSECFSHRGAAGATGRQLSVVGFERL